MPTTSSKPKSVPKLTFKIRPVQEKFYLKNPRLKRVGVQEEFSQVQINEWIKCSHDPVYFITKYCQIVHVDRGVIPFEMYDFQKEIIETYFIERKVIVKLPRQMGKALDISTPILTINGFKPLSDISVGDHIFGADGKPTRVTFITEVMTGRPCYEVRFSNGDAINADAEHLWTVHSSNWDGREKILTTEELQPYLTHTNKPYINFTSAVEFPTKGIPLPIDPYILGVWLGDGNSWDSRITCHKDDFSHYQQTMEFLSTYTDKRNDNVLTANIKNLHKKLRLNQLLGNKHIPHNYMFATQKDRILLLQGLMDTDGSVTNKQGTCQWYQKRKHLIESFRTLLSSLGVKSTLHSKIVKGETYYTVTFMPKFPVFSLERKSKKQRYLNHPKNTRLYLSSITPINSTPVRCLQVDNESHLFLAGSTLIPTHNTTTTAAFFLWYILFQKHKVCAILANKAPIAQEILGRIQLMYENIPSFIQQGIVEWNKRSITLENGSRILAAATSSSAIRGFSLSMVFMDEFAHVPNNIAEEFFTSTFPTLSSGKETKILMASTPNGLNHYCEFWTKAINHENDFVPIEYTWDRVPDRDMLWFKEQHRTLGEQKFRQEVLCEFLGSSNTLISGAKLAIMIMSHKQPIFVEGSWKVYEQPRHDHGYVICVDPARGLNQDASAFWVIDISQIPYRAVAQYSSASINPIVFPNLIYNAAIRYNHAFVLVEINDNGQQIVDMLHYDLEYENIFKLESSQKQGAKISSGYKKTMRLGLRMTESVKRIGCLNLKTLIEQDKLLLDDFATISELSTFTQQLQTFKAESGKHDDLVMCLVMFAWLVTQKYFRESQGAAIDIRKALEDEQMAMTETDLVPFGIIDTGLEDPFTVEDGELWVTTRGMDQDEMRNFMVNYVKRSQGL